MGRQAKSRPQGLPGPQGQQGWAPEAAYQPQPVTEWSEPAAKAAPAVGSFRPVQVIASLYAEIIEGQQQAWATMIGAARASRVLNRY